MHERGRLTFGVKEWEPLLVLPEPGPARCSPGCPAPKPPLAAAAGEDLTQTKQLISIIQRVKYSIRRSASITC